MTESESVALPFGHSPLHNMLIIAQVADFVKFFLNIMIIHYGKDTCNMAEESVARYPPLFVYRIPRADLSDCLADLVFAVLEIRSSKPDTSRNRRHVTLDESARRHRRSA